MSVTRTLRTHSASDHFEPESAADPQAQRRLRGHLEQIDYTAFACNREVIGHVLGGVEIESFQRLALAAASARARWAAAALQASETAAPTAEQIARLTELRVAFQELTEAYEGLRRMVERGYVAYRAAQAG